MKAVWLEGFGGPEVLQVVERPDPAPGGGEARVRVMACSLNHLDLWVRRGKSFPRPIIPGSDLVGVVEAVGPGVREVRPGDEVVAYPALSAQPSPARLRGDVPLSPDFGILGAHRDGALSERAVLPAENLLPKPATLAWHEAACLPIAFMTAWHMLFSRGRLRSDETVLIHSAGSGVSHGAIQMARLAGARVIATTGSDDKAARAKALGADEVIIYGREDVPARVRELTGGRGADLVLDHNGAATWEASTKSLAAGGRLVICGVTQGAAVSLDLGRFFFASQAVLGSTLGRAEELMQVIDLAARGRIRPVIDSVYPLTDIRAAHQRMADPQRFGKVVISVAS